MYADAIKTAGKKARPNDPVVASGEGTRMEAARWQEHQRRFHFAVVLSVLLQSAPASSE